MVIGTTPFILGHLIRDQVILDRALRVSKDGPMAWFRRNRASNESSVRVSSVRVPPDLIPKCGIVADHDLTRVAFAAGEAGSMCVCLNGDYGGTYDTVAGIAVGTNSLAYAAERN